jgi:hypothetical protein
MTFDSNSVNMAFSLFVIPFLISSFPDLPLSTLPTDKRLVKIEVWQSPVCVDMTQLAVIGSDGRRMMLLLLRVKMQHSFRFTQLSRTRVTTCIKLLGHILGA